MKISMKYAVLPAALLATGLVAACGSGTMTVHGQLTDSSALTGSTCALNEQSGDQVVITDPGGTVLATSSLRENVRQENKLEKNPSAKALAAESGMLSGLSGGTAVDAIGVYDFSAQVPGGNAHYAVKVDGQTVWFTAAQMTKGPQLGCG